jgi:hypothetical protein
MAKKKEEEFEFELDEDDKIDEYASEVNLILTVLGEIDQDLANSVLTNSTKFVDFDLSNEEMDQIVQAVGLVVKHDDNIIDIAKKLRDNA